MTLPSTGAITTAKAVAVPQTAAPTLGRVRPFECPKSSARIAAPVANNIAPPTP